uniref:Uncharacterized protein n=1 Tax=Aegilops tauschii subsp. strangulata TaxID=200361 RepID=A0A453K396_AEGTS
LAILVHDLGLFKYELSFLVLVGFFIGSLVFPSKHLEAIMAMDIGHRVKPVMSCLSSLAPVATFMAREKSNARPFLPFLSCY